MRIKTITTVLLLANVPAYISCASSQARQHLMELQAHQKLNTDAWLAARERLKRMCPPVPSTKDEYERGKSSRQAGSDPFLGCDVRIMKLTNSPRLDDWQWAWAPRYQTIIAVHEEELRKRVNPRVYEEYMLGISRYLAQKADSGEIAPTQIMSGFNEAWSWMTQQIVQEHALLQDSVRAAEISDAAMWNTFGSIAAGLALVTAAALITSATTSPQPTILTPTYTHISCQATPGLRNTITGQLYAVNIHCQ